MTPSTDPSTRAPVFRGIPIDWPLVGRSTERAFLSEAIATEKYSGVVLAGEAGVGKTRLALEALKEAERRGCSTSWVVASRSAASIPFGAFAHLLGDLPAGSLSRLDLLRQVAEALVARAGGHRLVIGVDDAYELDDASAALVHQLCLSRRAFVLITLRAGESAPDSIVGLWKDGLAERLELESLTEDDVRELVPLVLGSQVDAPTIARLWGATRGNALFLRELLLAGLDTGALTKAGGVWSWRGPKAASFRLQEIVAARLGTLEPDQVALMEVVAHGEPVSASLLEKLFRASVLEAAERRRVVTVEVDGRRTVVRLSHPLYGETTRARCPALRARAVHRELARALEATGARRAEDILRLASFRLEAGEPEHPDLLLAAARRAWASFDLRLAERLSRAAAAAGGGIPAKLAIAGYLIDQGHAREAAELLNEVNDVDLNEAERAVASILRADAVWLGLDRPGEAQQILLEAEKVIDDPRLRDELRAGRASILCLAGHLPEAIQAAEQVLGRRGASEEACATAAPAAVVALGIVGRAEQAVATAKRWIGPASAGGFRDVPFQLRVAESLALCLAGRIAEAGAIAEEVHREAIARNADEQAAVAAAFVGYVALTRGKLPTAIHYLREAAAALRFPSRVNYLPFCLAWLAQASAVAGDLDMAETALAGAKAAMSPAVALYESQLGLARAWIAASHGEVSRARQVAAAVATTAQASGQHAVAVVALHDLTRFGDPSSSRMHELVLLVDGPFAPACAAHAAALAAQDGSGLDQAAASFAAIGAELLAAETAAEAAAMHAAEGRRAAMLASSARAQRWLEACEAARTPPFSALATPLLTPREREVATLAGKGMSNIEIADRLVLSTRTVESHLQRAYAKLGVANRRELRAFLPPPERPTHGASPP